MLDFRLDEEYEALRKTVEEFAREEVAPVIGGFYEREEFPYEIVAKMGRMGLFGLPFPEEFGGMGGDYFALCLALEELARVDSSVAITVEARSEEHTSELQSPCNLVCRLLLEKKKERTTV